MVSILHPHVLVLIVCILSLTQVSSYKVLLKKFKFEFAVTLGASLLILNPAIASAQVDCNRNCLGNCAKVAPGSIEYCKTSCNEYCEQTDRYDRIDTDMEGCR